MRRRRGHRRRWRQQGGERRRGQKRRRPVLPAVAARRQALPSAETGGVLQKGRPHQQTLGGMPLLGGQLTGRAPGGGTQWTRSEAPAGRGS